MAEMAEEYPTLYLHCSGYLSNDSNLGIILKKCTNLDIYQWQLEQLQNPTKLVM